MTIAKRKERQKEELKARILQAAKELFIEKGFEQTSIRNIAERIEYSPTTIYLYYKDKDDIFYSLHQEGFVLMNQHFRPLANVVNPLERLKAMGRTYLTFAAENPELYRLMFILESPLKKTMKEAKNGISPDDCLAGGEWPEGERAFEFLVNTAQECIDQGFFKNVKADVMAFTIWSLVHGVASLDICCRLTMLTEGAQVSLKEDVSRVIDRLLDTMRHEPDLPA